MIPGIFNDVIGPVMRGPSSSHTAATWRIARVCLELLNEPLQKAKIEFDKRGVWAHNYEEQGTVMGINGGMLGLEITDPQMIHTELLLKKREIAIDYKISSFDSAHVNTIRISLQGIHGKNMEVFAASLGGGLFNINQVDGFKVNIRGDFHELLIRTKQKLSLVKEVQKILHQEMQINESINEHQDRLIHIKYSKGFPLEIIQKLNLLAQVKELSIISPILPVVSGNDTKLPFSHLASLMEYAEKENHDLGDLGIIYEKHLSGLSKIELIDKMKALIHIIENSIEEGLGGTDYEDRILPQQSHLIKEAEKKGKILQNSIVNTIIANVTAIMEVKSAMGVIVANPTAGSCGTVGALIKAISDDLASSPEEVVKAYFAAGVIGSYFAAGPGFSAEEHGCQVECGAACGMAAAATVQLMGGTAQQAIDAASMAIQNMIGLICDPVADRVEVPCLGKNISAALNAYASATMVCSGFKAIIPLQEVIETVSRVSQQMPDCLKCTGKGGLAITKTALDLKIKLRENGSK